jgi:membrane-associated phospholipid phosphatase
MDLHSKREQLRGYSQLLLIVSLFFVPYGNGGLEAYYVAGGMTFLLLAMTLSPLFCLLESERGWPNLTAVCFALESLCLGLVIYHGAALFAACVLVSTIVFIIVAIPERNEFLETAKQAGSRAQGAESQT